MVQLTPLLYAVAKSADGERDYAAMAEVVAADINRGVSEDNVRTLVNDKLRPLGILAGPDGSTPPIEKPDPLLALKFRKAIIPERVSYKVARLFKPLLFLPVVLAVLAGLVVFDVWLFGQHGVAQAFGKSLQSPGFIMLILVLVVVSAGWHEFGHAAGCAYGGAKPGAMGAGLYLAYPAFYTDVTDSYRLSKGGRLRTDLAGVYFNALFILITAGVYAITGFEPLLLVIVTQHIEAAHQLLPILRLDGYYVLADATGVPDLFSRIKPILVSALPWKKPDARVTELKPWVRVVVTLWVVVVVPLLILQVGLILLHLPRLIATAWDSLGKQYDTVTKAFGKGDVLVAGIGIVQALILVLPVLGITLSFGRVGRRLVTKGWQATEGSAVARIALGAVTVAAVGVLAYTWVPNGDYKPIGPRERGTLGEGLHAVAKVATGKPSLVPVEKAAERDADGPASKTSPGASTTTTVAHSGSATTVPAGSATTTPASESATTSTTRARAGATTTVEPTTTIRRATTTTAG